MARYRLQPPTERALAVAGVLWLLADHAYYLWPAGSMSRAWAEHVIKAVAGGATLWAVRHCWASGLWAFVVWTALLNRAQEAGCSALTWAGWAPGWWPGSGDLCLRIFGRDVYAAAAALLGAVIITTLERPWRRIK